MGSGRRGPMSSRARREPWLIVGRWLEIVVEIVVEIVGLVDIFRAGAKMRHPR